MRVGKRSVAVVAGLAMAVSGCGSTSSSSSPAGDSRFVGTVKTQSISQSGFQGTWPFTVSSGTVSCDEVGSVTFTAPDGSIYGVNGTAQDHGFPNVTPIWKKDPSHLVPRVSVGDVISAGMALCGH